MEREEMKWQAFMVGENTVLFREYFSCGQEKQNINIDTYIYLILRILIDVALR